MNILFLSRWFPFPRDNGSKLRIFHLLRGLSKEHHVTLLSFSDAPLSSVSDNPGGDMPCDEVQVVPWKPFNRKSAEARLGLLSPLPRSLLDTHSPQMDSLIRSTLKRRKIDLVIASQLSMAAYNPSFQGVPALFEEIELGLYYEQAFNGRFRLDRLRARLSWLKLQQYLLHMLNMFHSCTVVSEEECQLFVESFHIHEKKVEILPNCIDLRDYQNLNVARRPNHLVFTGSFTYGPNYQAMQWFVSLVFPLILKEIPDAHLSITGNHADLPVPKMENITLAGYIKDIRSLVASSDVSIAPLWSGGGTRLKILEAMAIGTPVVATSKGAEGLSVENGKNIYIADDPHTFAKHVVTLIREKKVRDSLVSNAAMLVKEHYDLQIIMPRFLHLVEKAAAGLN
jgi:glycosyltransferase involved in cell wall biosynthesis